LLDGAHGFARQRDSARDCAQVAADECYWCSRHGYIRARANCQPHVGLGQRRRVIDAVAHHCHHLAAFLQFLDLGGLALGQYVCQHHIHANLPGDGLGSALVVAGDHGYLQPHAMQFGNGFLRAFLYRVGHGHRADHAVIQRYQHGGFGLVLKIGHHGFHAIHIVTTGAHHAHITYSYFVAIHIGTHAMPGLRREALRIAEQQPAVARFGHQRFADGVLASFFHRCGQPQQLIFSGRKIAHDNVGHSRLAAGDGAGLVQHNHLDLSRLLQRATRTEQHA